VSVGREADDTMLPALGYLTKDVFSGYAEPMRYTGVTMSLVGLAALPFAPETKGKPLPE
jgi:hypothetical protein